MRRRGRQTRRRPRRGQRGRRLTRGRSRASCATGSISASDPSAPPPGSRPGGMGRRSTTYCRSPCPAPPPPAARARLQRPRPLTPSGAPGKPAVAHASAQRERGSSHSSSGSTHGAPGRLHRNSTMLAAPSMVTMIATSAAPPQCRCDEPIDLRGSSAAAHRAVRTNRPPRTRRGELQHLPGVDLASVARVAAGHFMERRPQKRCLPCGAAVGAGGVALRPRLQRHNTAFASGWSDLRVASRRRIQPGGALLLVTRHWLLPANTTKDSVSLSLSPFVCQDVARPPP